MSADLPLTPEDVADIVAVLDGGGYDRLDIRTPRFRLRLARAEGGWTQDWDYSEEAAPAAEAAAAPAASVELGEGLLAIRATLPGTFYRAPQPGAPPFVEAGATVGPDTTVAILETMKLMNPVHAGVAGVIEAVLAENAEAVEAGAVLMTVRPAS